MVRVLACRAKGRGFKSRLSRFVLYVESLHKQKLSKKLSKIEGLLKIFIIFTNLCVMVTYRCFQHPKRKSFFLVKPKLKTKPLAKPQYSFGTKAIKSKE
jgi:hypothetical protein